MIQGAKQSFGRVTNKPPKQKVTYDRQKWLPHWEALTDSQRSIWSYDLARYCIAMEIKTEQKF